MESMLIPVIRSNRLFNLVLVQCYDDGVTKILWQLALLLAEDQKIVRLDMERPTAIHPDL